MKTISMLLCLFSLTVGAAPPKEGLLVTLKGTLSANGKPVIDARFHVAPVDSHLAMALDKAGRFEVTAVNSRGYVVDIDAEGYAPIRTVVELDENGIADLGAVTLEPLKKAKVSVVIAPREQLAKAVVQKVELRHGSCANVRAQDDSGCLFSVCVNQEGPTLQLSQYGSSQLLSLGTVSLAEARTRLTRGTSVTGPQQGLALTAGETWATEERDPYCGALMRVDEVK